MIKKKSVGLIEIWFGVWKNSWSILKNKIKSNITKNDNLIRLLSNLIIDKRKMIFIFKKKNKNLSNEY